ncbi:MAG: 50S ribosomal protein L1 [Acidobacteria bacterium]|nr:50S ribosomal protein L1 [Acidobacteriota bacterium]
MGKRYEQAKALVESRPYLLPDAVRLMKRATFAKFDETAELAVVLGVDPKRADQMVRGTVVLPHGLGKSKRVIAIVSGDKLKEAEQAGADSVGGEDMIEKISGGWLDFDAVVATPDLMKSISKLGRVLGPRGLMPNPKAGTVTFEVGKAIQEIKAGKVEFRIDKGSIVHAPFGKLSFDEEKLVANARALLEAISRAKPPTSKGKYIKSVTVSSTMGPGIHVDPASVEAAA